MITMKMKLINAIVPQEQGAVITLKLVDDTANSAKVDPVSIHITDSAVAERLSLGDVLEVAIKPADELRRDAWAKQQIATPDPEVPEKAKTKK